MQLHPRVRGCSPFFAASAMAASICSMIIRRTFFWAASLSSRDFTGKTFRFSCGLRSSEGFGTVSDPFSIPWLDGPRGEDHKKRGVSGAESFAFFGRFPMIRSCECRRTRYRPLFTPLHRFFCYPLKMSLFVLSISRLYYTFIAESVNF